MNTTTKKKPVRKTRAILVSALAAKVLGRTRVVGGTFTAQHMTMVFPAFNPLELANALEELMMKNLLSQKGQDARAIYSLTDEGRDGRVGVS
jgi:hypothetical protein